ncbi:Tail fiber protein, partial [Escherichia coli O111:H11 str. CVM9545]|uniref:phage tail fiber C-terminal domain-containing protein n=1 Tax=Escherichia coli TaxID=562 RepID=UPI0002638E1E
RQASRGCSCCRRRLHRPFRRDGSIIETNSNGWFPDTDGALITGLTFLDPKDATQVQGLFQHLQVRFGDGPWQDVKGLDEVGSDTGRTGE